MRLSGINQIPATMAYNAQAGTDNRNAIIIAMT